MRSAKVHDNFADQSEADELHAQGDHENGQQQYRTIGDALAFDPLDQEYHTENGATTQKERADQTKEPQRLLGEFCQKEERRNIEYPPEVDSGSINPRLGVARMLRHRHFIDQESFPQSEGRDETMQIAVQREGLRYRSLHDSNTAGHVMETLIGDTPDNTVE